jgi:hypothetical protein
MMVAGCAANTQDAVAQANAAFDVAAALEAAYAASPSADPKVVTEFTRLLSAGQAALVTWQNSSSPGDQQALNAAIAALVAYEATSGISGATH